MRQNLAFDVKHAGGGGRWAARLEIYETDPDPDMAKRTTQLDLRVHQAGYQGLAEAEGSLRYCLEMAGGASIVAGCRSGR